MVPSHLPAHLPAHLPVDARAQLKVPLFVLWLIPVKQACHTTADIMTASMLLLYLRIIADVLTTDLQSILTVTVVAIQPRAAHNRPVKREEKYE